MIGKGLREFWEHFKDRTGALFYNWGFRASVLFLLFVGIYYTIVLFRDYSKDTTAVSNVAFGVLATLAALSFSCSRSLEPEDKDKDRFAYVGERCLHASVLVLSASVLKYALLSLKSETWVAAHPVLTAVLHVALGEATGILFLWALLSAHTGLKVLSDLLRTRIARYPDWDQIV